MVHSSITDDIIDAEEAAKIIGVSARRIRKLCAEGRLGFRLGGRQFIIGRQEAEDFAKIERLPGRPPASKSIR